MVTFRCISISNKLHICSKLLKYRFFDKIIDSRTYKAGIGDTDVLVSIRTSRQIHCEKRELSGLPALFSLLLSLQPPDLAYISGEARRISNKPIIRTETLSCVCSFRLGVGQ